MALNTKNKRGSVMDMGSPFRQWLAEPDGALSSFDRMSIIKLGAAIAADPPTPAPSIIGSIFKSSIIVGAR